MFKEEDFHSTIIKIEFSNDSTMTAPKNYLKNQKIQVTLNEVSNNGLIIEAPIQSCAEGHFVSLKIHVKKGAKDFHFQTSAKVTHTEVLDQLTQRITTEFTRFNQKDLHNFLSFFESEQNAALDLFHKIKGLE